MNYPMCVDYRIWISAVFTGFR